METAVQGGSLSCFPRLACLFLKRGANMSAVDADGKDPLSIAIDSANADIVTL